MHPIRSAAAICTIAVAVALGIAACGGAPGTPGGTAARSSSLPLSDVSTPRTALSPAPLAAPTPRPLPVAVAGKLTAPWSLVDVHLVPPPPNAVSVPASVVYREFCFAPAPACPATQGQLPEIVLALGTDVSDPNQPVDPHSHILPTFRNLLVWAVVGRSKCISLGPPGASLPPDLTCTDVTLYEASTGRYLMGASAG